MSWDSPSPRLPSLPPLATLELLRVLAHPYCLVLMLRWGSWHGLVPCFFFLWFPVEMGRVDVGSLRNIKCLQYLQWISSFPCSPLSSAHWLESWSRVLTLENVGKQFPCRRDPVAEFEEYLPAWTNPMPVLSGDLVMPGGADPIFPLSPSLRSFWKWGRERFIRDEEESLDVVVHFSRTKQALVRGPKEWGSTVWYFLKKNLNTSHEGARSRGCLDKLTCRSPPYNKLSIQLI